MMPDFQAIVPSCPNDAPRFALRERVICLFSSETGEQHRDKGFIVGVLHDPTQFFREEWVYIVAIYNFSHADLQPLPCFDSAFESELIHYEENEDHPNP